MRGRIDKKFFGPIAAIAAPSTKETDRRENSKERKKKRSIKDQSSVYDILMLIYTYINDVAS